MEVSVCSPFNLLVIVNEKSVPDCYMKCYLLLKSVINTYKNKLRYFYNNYKQLEKDFCFNKAPC